MGMRSESDEGGRAGTRDVDAQPACGVRIGRTRRACVERMRLDGEAGAKFCPGGARGPIEDIDGFISGESSLFFGASANSVGWRRVLVCRFLHLPSGLVSRAPSSARHRRD